MAFDFDVFTKWNPGPALRREAFLGMELFFPADVKCFRVMQSEAPELQAADLALVAMFFSNSEFERILVYSDLFSNFF